MLRDVLFIMGMHRSGTSMTTRIVNLSGYTIGNESDLIKADSGNPTGYWEHRSFVSLNRKILAAHLMPKFVSEIFLPPLKKKACELVSNFKREGRLVLKDPIVSLILPFWIDVVHTCFPGENVKISTLICVRNPFDVSMSMKNRGLFINEINWWLWEKYIRAAIKNSEGLPRYMNHYENYLDERCDEEIKSLSAFLGVTLDDCRIKEIKQFINPDLKKKKRNTAKGIFKKKISRSARNLYLNLVRQKNRLSFEKQGF